MFDCADDGDMMTNHTELNTSTIDRWTSSVFFFFWKIDQAERVDIEKVWVPQFTASNWEWSLPKDFGVKILGERNIAVWGPKMSVLGINGEVDGDLGDGEAWK